MTPAARVAAAIEVLDDILSGQTAERALTGWGRTHRFAGSKDRAAIRDHVFQALRCRASYAWLGGAETGRGIMLGAARATGQVDDLFTGQGHAPPPVQDHEAGAGLNSAPRAVQSDIPPWQLDHFDKAFAGGADGILTTLKTRAGVFLRVNAAKTSQADAMAALAADGITTAVVDKVKTALQVTENERKVARSEAYTAGLVEVQDPSSQEAVLSLALRPNERVLDYCAGGGGKSLAMAAQGADVTAHDIDPKRMVDLTPRATRAGVRIATATTGDLGAIEKQDLQLFQAREIAKPFIADRRFAQDQSLQIVEFGELGNTLAGDLRFREVERTQVLQSRDAWRRCVGDCRA